MPSLLCANLACSKEPVVYECLMYVIIAVGLALIGGLVIVVVQEKLKERRRRERDTELDAWLADYSTSAFSPTDSSLHDI